MSTPTSVEQIVNLALGRIGYPEYVGNIYEGTRQATAALNIYAATRDAVLRAKDWPFALRQTAGVASGGTPPVGWTYAWNYPSDCLRVRSVMPTVAAFPVLDPRPLPWSLANVANVRTIVTQTTPIDINYLAQVTEIPQWEPLFVEALVQALAARLAILLRDLQPPYVDPERAVDVAVGADEGQPPNDARAAAPANGRPA